MGEYKIKLYYSTGNSYMSEDVYDYLELTWKNLNIAKENLQRIKEHYAMHRELDGYNSGDKYFKKTKIKNGLSILLNYIVLVQTMQSVKKIKKK